MPGPKKVDPAVLQQQFNVFDTSQQGRLRSSFVQIYSTSQLTEVWRSLNDLKGTMPSLSATTKDMTENWDQFLQKLHELSERFLKPAPKSKGKQKIYISSAILAYDQQIMRTIFFERDQQVTLDGQTYTIQKKFIDQSWNTKSAFVKLYDQFEYVQDLEPANLAQRKKAFTNVIKEFEKQYQKHVKLSHPELWGIIKKCLSPLIVLCEANYNLSLFQELAKKKKDLPSFRQKALMEKFCQSFQQFCDIISKFGKLEGIYNIKRMMAKLSLHDWERIRPLYFYIQPLKNQIDLVKDQLFSMKKDGIDHIKYPLANNEHLQALTIEMVNKDEKCEWILGNDLKIDQIKFLYEVVKQIYESPFKNELLNKDKTIIEVVIPQLTAFRSIQQIRSVLDKKKEAGIVEDKKLDESELKEDEQNPEEQEKKGDDNPLQGTMMTQTQFFAQKQKQEIQDYGRQWIWQGYISQKSKNDWLNAAESLRHINLHVCQDIQDFLIMKHFIKTETDRKKIQNRIDVAKNQKKAGKQKKAMNQLGVSEAEARKTLLERFRPPYCWNFFVQQNDPHQLRIDASPDKCYLDTRVQEFLQEIGSLALHLRNHQSEIWNRLVKDVWVIFEAEEAEKAD